MRVSSESEKPDSILSPSQAGLLPCAHCLPPVSSPARVGAGAPAMTYDEKLPACLACHGEKGISETSEVPSLAGMPADFTLIQLFLFRQNTRKIEIMNDLAKDMTDDDLRKFAEYFVKLPPPKASGDPADPAIAARAQGVIAKNHCASCHNPDFSGREQMPRLAAQREDYLLKACATTRPPSVRATTPRWTR